MTSEEAEKIVAQAVEMGFEHYKSGNNDKAESLYRQILCVDADNVVALQMLGLIESRKPGQSEAAVEKLKRAEALDPDNADVHNNLGLVYSWSDAKDAALATSHYERAIGLNPQAMHFYSNLGVHLKSQGDAAAAEAVLLRGLAAQEASSMLHFNYATLLGEAKRWPEAKRHYERTIELDPTFASGHYNLSTVYLNEGDLVRGWPEYEWRWETYPEFKRIHTRFPDEKRWDGKTSPVGKRFFLYAEQGMGDTIQFSRFVKTLKDRGAAHITLEEHADLIALMRGLAGQDRIVTYGDSVDDFDLHCSVVSLPHLLGITDLRDVPNDPYLRCNYAEVRDSSAMLDRHWHVYGGIRVGIVWAGNPVHRHDPLRSTTLANFRRLLLPGVRLFSLQKDVRPRFWPGIGERDLTAGADGMNVVDLKDFLFDYNGTAALIDRMDLIIAVDTATAHLAAAMGKPTWILIPYHNDWRWLKEGETSPWYPSVRLFRQPAAGDWESVFADAEQALRQLLAGREV